LLAVATTDRLDARSPTPLWAQLATVLRKRLADGLYFDRFPTEMELTAEFEVSRATVREAVRRLKDEGILDARRGSGTFVVRRQLDQGLMGQISLARAIVAAGLEEDSQVLRLAEGRAGEAADHLGLGATDPVVWVERARHAGGRALALDCSALALGEQERAEFLDADLGRGSIYDVLAARCNIQVTGATEEVRAVRCSPEEVAMLGLDEGEGTLLVERISYTGTIPIEWRRSLLRGEAYVLSSSWGVVPAAG
jgi:GntR family transcriptional regulator